MFGFLKDKLKKAIGAFSSSAKDEVKEEVIETPAPKKAAPKKETPTPAKKAPEQKKATPAPVQAPEQKPEAKKAEPPKPAAKPEPKATATPKAHDVEKPVARKPEPPKPITKPEPVKPKKVVEQKPQPKKTEPVKAEPKVEEKKPGFFGRLFGKKEEESAERVAATEAVAPPAEPEMFDEESDEEAAESAPFTDEDEGAEDEEATHEEVVAQEPAREEEPAESTGFFGRLKSAVTKRTLSPEKFDEIFWELELAMLENNVAVEVIEKIKSDLREELTTGKVSRLDLEGQVSARLKQSIEELFSVPTFDLIARIKKAPKPFKLCIIGINGSGKTTTLAKIIKKLQDNDLSVVVAASDTFRAAAIQQLGEHCERLDVKMISQGYGADPAAVAFDAIKHAESKEIDVVLIDTAGRLHSNTNLMAELEKVIRVAKPDLKIFVGEAITGNDCVEQAKTFDELVGIDAIILSKADVDEKGGAAISVSYVTGKPILYLGTGQTYEDLEEFDKEKLVGALGL